MPLTRVSQPRSFDYSKTNNSIDRILEIRYCAEHWHSSGGEVSQGPRVQE